MILDRMAHLPPATHVLRPERPDPRPEFWDRVSRRLTGGLVRRMRTWRNPAPGFVARVEREGRALETLGDTALRAAADKLRERFHREGLQEPLVARAFALVREVGSRTVGMRHFDTQLIGGRVLLEGMVAEMETGEGKTLTATLPAATAALAGIPVHVITVNDYLTDRDARWMGRIYAALGIRVGCVVHDLPHEDRRAAYACDVTYCTNKEVAFDYLRDWIVLAGRRDPLRLQAGSLCGGADDLKRLLLRGLHFGIVDEADSILIDEARTPLVISRSTGNAGESEFLAQAMTLAGRLEAAADYHIDERKRAIKLTEDGKRRVRRSTAALGPLWTGRVRRDETIRLALTAMQFFKRDEQYLVRDGKIQIIDEFTGRVMPDRSYERGLHQLIEIKEGCEITRQLETQARISYQRFFRRYLHLAGMTGTAREVRRELGAVYNLPVVRVPPHRPMRRRALADRLFPTQEEKWRAVVDTIRRLHAGGRPVLVGTRSVAASETAARLLDDLGFSYQVLNAKQDAREAAVVARAGEAGCVTIATNMAGRGTDIQLGPGVAERQGLHVVLTERHEAARIDRQLAGRCARLGDPGSYGAILSLEDPILEAGRGGLAAWLAMRFARPGSRLWTWLARRAVSGAQKRIERMHARVRRALLHEDEQRGDMLSFSGRSE